MKKLFNNPWFIGALGMFALGYLGVSVVMPLLADDPTQVESADFDMIGIDEDTGFALGAPAQARSVITEDIGWLNDIARDPFTGTVIAAEVDEAQLPVVGALFVGAQVQAAVINNRLVRVGDMVDQFKVTHIADQHVQVTYAGRSFRLEPDV